MNLPNKIQTQITDYLAQNNIVSIYTDLVIVRGVQIVYGFVLTNILITQT